MLPVLDPSAAAKFYVQLGFVISGGDPQHELVLERESLQLVLVRADAIDPDDGRPRFVCTVTIEVLEAMWVLDARDERTLPGPTLSAEGAFEYRTRDPSGNRVRLLAYLPDPGAS